MMKKTIRYIIELIHAVIYLHNELNFIHCDLKLSNVTISNEDHVVLIDFGLCQKKGDQKQERGTDGYLCRENKTQHVSYENDVFSIGSMIYEIFSGRNLFLHHDTNTPYDPLKTNWSHLENNIPLKKFKYDEDKDIFFPDNFPMDLKSLIRKMVAFNREDRISLEAAKVILENYYLVNWNKTVDII